MKGLILYIQKFTKGRYLSYGFVVTVSCVASSSNMSDYFFTSGLLPKWWEVSSGKFECSLGIHARRNCDHSGRGVQSEERARNLSREDISPGAWVLVSILVPNFSSLCIIERAVVLQWEVSEDDVSEYGKI